MQYSYSFDDELQQDWRWPEYFSPQADLEAYANHVADRFGLREMIRFGARVNRLRFDEQASRWHVSTERGDQVSARYVVAASGALDATNIPDFPGLESFGGEWHHTSQWPKAGRALRRPAGRADRHRVDRPPGHDRDRQDGRAPVRLPADARLQPAGQQPAAAARTTSRTGRTTTPSAATVMRQNFAAGYLPVPQYGSVFDYSPRGAQRILEQAWSQRNGLLFLRTFTDTMQTLEANEVIAEFIRGKIRQIVKDPDVAELLCPKTYPVGTKRICMDTGYFETFNRPNVTLVDVRTNPITEITPTGLRTTAGQYELDMLILATGFDAVTGSLTRMNITGRGGIRPAREVGGRPDQLPRLHGGGLPEPVHDPRPGQPRRARPDDHRRRVAGRLGHRRSSRTWTGAASPDRHDGRGRERLGAPRWARWPPRRCTGTPTPGTSARTSRASRGTS